MTVDVEVKGLSRGVRGGVCEAAYCTKHGKYGWEWIDGWVGGEKRDMNDGYSVKDGMYGRKVVLGTVAETTNGASIVPGVS